MNKRCVFANSKGSGSLFVERAGHFLMPVRVFALQLDVVR